MNPAAAVPAHSTYTPCCRNDATRRGPCTVMALPASSPRLHAMLQHVAACTAKAPGALGRLACGSEVKAAVHSSPSTRADHGSALHALLVTLSEVLALDLEEVSRWLDTVDCDAPFIRDLAMVRANSARMQMLPSCSLALNGENTLPTRNLGVLSCFLLLLVCSSFFPGHASPGFHHQHFRTSQHAFCSQAAHDHLTGTDTASLRSLVAAALLRRERRASIALERSSELLTSIAALEANVLGPLATDHAACNQTRPPTPAASSAEQGTSPPARLVPADVAGRDPDTVPHWAGQSVPHDLLTVSLPALPAPPHDAAGAGQWRHGTPSSQAVQAAQAAFAPQTVYGLQLAPGSAPVRCLRKVPPRRPSWLASAQARWETARRRRRRQQEPPPHDTLWAHHQHRPPAEASPRTAAAAAAEGYAALNAPRPHALASAVAGLEIEQLDKGSAPVSRSDVFYSLSAAFRLGDADNALAVGVSAQELQWDAQLARGRADTPRGDEGSDSDGTASRDSASLPRSKTGILTAADVPEVVGLPLGSPYATPSGQGPQPAAQDGSSLRCQAGVRIVAVQAGSPAGREGLLRPHDLVLGVAVDGSRVWGGGTAAWDIDAFTHTLQSARLGGKRATLTIARPTPLILLEGLLRGLTPTAAVDRPWPCLVPAAATAGLSESGSAAQPLHPVSALQDSPLGAALRSLAGAGPTLTVASPTALGCPLPPAWMPSLSVTPRYTPLMERALTPLPRQPPHPVEKDGTGPALAREQHKWLQPGEPWRSELQRLGPRRGIMPLMPPLGPLGTRAAYATPFTHMHMHRTLPLAHVPAIMDGLFDSGSVGRPNQSLAEAGAALLRAVHKHVVPETSMLEHLDTVSRSLRLSSTWAATVASARALQCPLAVPQPLATAGAARPAAPAVLGPASAVPTSSLGPLHTTSNYAGPTQQGGAVWPPLLGPGPPSPGGISPRHAWEWLSKAAFPGPAFLPTALASSALPARLLALGLCLYHARIPPSLSPREPLSPPATNLGPSSTPDESTVHLTAGLATMSDASPPRLAQQRPGHVPDSSAPPHPVPEPNVAMQVLSAITACTVSVRLGSRDFHLCGRSSEPVSTLSRLLVALRSTVATPGPALVSSVQPCPSVRSQTRLGLPRLPITAFIFPMPASAAPLSPPAPHTADRPLAKRSCALDGGKGGTRGDAAARMWGSDGSTPVLCHAVITGAATTLPAPLLSTLARETLAPLLPRFPPRPPLLVHALRVESLVLSSALARSGVLHQQPRILLPHPSHHTARLPEDAPEDADDPTSRLVGVLGCFFASMAEASSQLCSGAKTVAASAWSGSLPGPVTSQPLASGHLAEAAPGRFAQGVGAPCVLCERLTPPDLPTVGSPVKDPSPSPESPAAVEPAFLPGGDLDKPAQLRNGGHVFTLAERLSLGHLVALCGGAGPGEQGRLLPGEEVALGTPAAQGPRPGAWMTPSPGSWTSPLFWLYMHSTLPAVQAPGLDKHMHALYFPGAHALGNYSTGADVGYEPVAGSGPSPTPPPPMTLVLPQQDTAQDGDATTTSSKTESGAADDGSEAPGDGDEETAAQALQSPAAVPHPTLLGSCPAAGKHTSLGAWMLESLHPRAAAVVASAPLPTHRQAQSSEDAADAAWLSHGAVLACSIQAPMQRVEGGAFQAQGVSAAMPEAVARAVRAGEAGEAESAAAAAAAVSPDPLPLMLWQRTWLGAPDVIGASFIALKWWWATHRAVLALGGGQPTGVEAAALQVLEGLSPTSVLHAVHVSQGFLRQAGARTGLPATGGSKRPREQPMPEQDLGSAQAQWARLLLGPQAPTPFQPATPTSKAWQPCDPAIVGILARSLVSAAVRVVEGAAAAPAE